MEFVKSQIHALNRNTMLNAGSPSAMRNPSIQKNLSTMSSIKQQQATDYPAQLAS